MIIGDLEHAYDYVNHQMGTASTLGPEPEDETIKALHQVIKDVTGKAPEQPQKPRIGFY